MGQKVHPYGFRLGYNKNWQSRWFSKKDYPAFLYEDHEVRKYVKKLLYSAGISKIEIRTRRGQDPPHPFHRPPWYRHWPQGRGN